MEMYSLGGEIVKVILSEEELSEHNVDLIQGLHGDQAEKFFASLLRKVAIHYGMKPTLYLDAEVAERDDGGLLLTIQFIDDKGEKKRICQSTPRSHNGLLFRFSKKEDLLALADLLENNAFTGGTLWEWDTFFYLLMRHDGSQQLPALLGEYGEEACVDPKTVAKRGKLLKAEAAIETLATRQI
ncbi:hypothetical protein [Alteribacillus iranensis]|uniref:Adapter protein MecA 1/2 n=1 Tax=Alteribacillus iranensis TaxID=930128 RepID=A0A1I1ZNT3_9BACI|nr:hypothetical protein [Alteribacillus iranensis]SFE33356.1 hypothetical protein SAMN05192532_101356 [Alteribacillus iranensis]